MGPDAEHATPGDLCQSAAGRAARRDDLHHLDQLQPDERWPARGHGREGLMDALVPKPDRGGPAQPLLSATGLRKHFPVMGGLLGRTTKVVRAVDDLSLSVAKGETLGVVGESGCGKSTVARLLIRLLKPDRGTMVLDGDPVDEPHGVTINQLRRQVQMVFQDSYASLNPRLTIAETLAFAPKAHGVPANEARERVRDLLAKVGLDPKNYTDRYPHE